MKINIPNKRESYEVGDLIEIQNGFRMIINCDNYYYLMDMYGKVTTIHYNSIEELLKGRTILNHYKNKDLELSLK